MKPLCESLDMLCNQYNFELFQTNTPVLSLSTLSRKNGRGWSLRPEIHQVRESVQACTEIHYIAHSLLHLHQNSDPHSSTLCEQCHIISTCATALTSMCIRCTKTWPEQVSGPEEVSPLEQPLRRDQHPMTGQRPWPNQRPILGQRPIPGQRPWPV